MVVAIYTRRIKTFVTLDFIIEHLNEHGSVNWVYKLSIIVG